MVPSPAVDDRKVPAALDKALLELPGGIPEAMLLLLPNGSAYQVPGTSTPIVTGGKVVAGLSVLCGFEADFTWLTENPELRDAGGTTEGQ